MSVKRNTWINLMGSGAPIAIVLVTMPIYLRIIGEARYGVLALIWVLTGYFGLFELGMGRATAYHIARLSSEETHDRETIFWSALFLNTVFGLIGAILLFLIAQYCYTRFFNMPKEFLPEVSAALPWVALTILISTVSSVGQGALQGRECFVAMNVLGVLGSILNQVVPLAAAWFVSRKLGVLVASIVIARLIGVGLLLEIVRRSLPVYHMPFISLLHIRSLLSFGGWVSISSILAPLLTTLDRFLIGAIAGPIALTHYTVPVNLTQQFTLLSSSLAGALFPHFAGQATNDRLMLAQRAVRAVSSLLTPCIVIAMFCMKPFLSIWVGEEFSQIAAPIGVIILIGVWFNSLAYVPYGLLHGSGTPRSIAVAHLCEVPLYMFVLYFSTLHFGIVGAVCVTVARLSLDAVVLALLAQMRLTGFGYLIPSIVILLFSQAAALWLTAYNIFRALATLVLCIALVYLGCRNSVDFALLLRRILNYFPFQRLWHWQFPKIR